MYKQIKSANTGVAGRSGYCLVYARNVFSVGSRYASAQLAWNAASFKHTGTPPSEVAVPVWYRWGKDGHVAVSKGGKIWSTTKQGVKSFSSVQELGKYIGGTYLGWSEDINAVRVVQPVTVSPPPTGGLPAIGSKIRFIPTQTRTTFKVGTAVKAGELRVTDNSYIYVVRGHDTKYPGRVIINSASAGGNGIGIALYYLSGARVDGWVAA